VQGEVKASHLLAEPQMLLTEEQRFLRAKVRQDGAGGAMGAFCGGGWHEKTFCKWDEIMKM